VYPCTRTHAPPGVRGKQFLGVRKILARISPNLHEKFLGHFLCKYFLTKTVFVMISKTRSSRASANVGCHFFNQTKLGTIFVHIFREFAQIFKDFAKVSADFAQIFTKSKLLEAPPCTPASYLFACELQGSTCLQAANFPVFVHRYYQLSIHNFFFTTRRIENEGFTICKGMPHVVSWRRKNSNKLLHILVNDINRTYGEPHHEWRDKNNFFSVFTYSTQTFRAMKNSLQSKCTT